METAIIRLFILVAIFATIFLISQVLLATVWRGRSESLAVNRRLKMISGGADREVVIASLRKNAPRYDEKYPPFVRKLLNHFRRMLLASGLGISMGQVMLLMAGLVFAITVLLMFVARSAKIPLTLGVMEIILTFSVAVAVAVPLFILNFMAQRRRRKVEQQFPIALDIFVRALRSGHPIASAIQLLTEEMEDPIGSEFGLVSDEVSYGAELADALFAMGERWDVDDIRMFVVSLMVQSETGGNLAEILENLAEVIRARASMFLKVRALSSEGRMTAWVLTGAPVFAFVSLFISNPKFYMDVAMDRMFLIGFPGLLVLYFVGFFTIRRMIDLKV
jgi:tight adherence protein B